MYKRSYEEYRKSREEAERKWRKERFREILRKETPLSTEDRIDFWNGLTREDKSTASLLCVATLQEIGCSGTEILELLRAPAL